MSEKKPARLPEVKVTLIKAHDPGPAPVTKAETGTQLSKDSSFSAGDWLSPKVPLEGYKRLVNESSILPQCIRAYKNNIPGFGIGVRYKEDYRGKETAEMKAEYAEMQTIIAQLNLDIGTKKVFENSVENQETYGVTYIEAIRNGEGKIVEVIPFDNIPSVQKTKPLEPYADMVYQHNGERITRKKKFRKYRQTIGSSTVYFKELGDSRIMDKQTGDYTTALADEHRANEIIELSIGSEPYGDVRWIGQVLGIDGSRKAEMLNNRYFTKGRHTPMMILLKGGTLSENSKLALKEYMTDIEGEKGQHQFVVLEVENMDEGAEFEGVKPPEIEIKDMAAVLQKDELFQDYLDNNRRKIQSSFLLPDLYVGYTTDFNRSTAQTAMEVTEKQVFQPERKSLAWILNNRILVDYNFKYCEAFFLEPDITNPDDLAKILNITERAGGLPPNKAKEITFKIMGETPDDYPEEWGGIPLAYLKAVAVPSSLSLPDFTAGLDKQIQKAAGDNNDAVVAVMKEVAAFLRKMERDGRG